MEFKRGKTFIKSSMQLTHEKLPLVGLSPREKDNAGKDIKERNLPNIETAKSSFSEDKCDSISNRSTKTGSSESILLVPESFYKPVRKSKTHDCVVRSADKAEQCGHNSNISEEGVVAPGRTKGRLVNSASFSGFGNAQNSHGKKDSVVNSSHFLNSPQQMIDYRNFVPQMPFVPAVAKSIPRKRISLKRSKKGFRDIFHIKKNKSENLALLSEKQKRLPFPGCKSELAGRLGKYFFKAGETFTADCLAQDISDGELLSESSYEYSSALCEDVASLKSFDSLTGCGEIFADESSAHMELEISKEILQRQSQQKDNPAMGSFQGGVEQLASPAQNEAADFAKLWDNINKSVQLHQKTLFDRRLLKIPSSKLAKARYETSASVTDLLSSPDSSKESSIDTGTPKSDNQESMSTSDEGYYDSFSPGQDDELKSDQSPGVPGRFPRDSYSGDALYELFCDPSEAQISPGLDDDLCMSESISEKAIEIPLSIYSFHVGSEENMASQPAVDIISQGFLHSTWKGKECLLKLCDTELSLTMGIINWLRKNPGLISPQDFPKNPQSQLEKDGEPIPTYPSTHKNGFKAALEENTMGPEASSICTKNGTYSCSVGRTEQRQSDSLTCESPQESSQEREGTLSAMSPLITDNSASYDMHRSEESWDDLLMMSSSEMEKISLVGECTDPGTETLSFEALNLETIFQNDENLLAMDNHDAESCSSYMTAATSPDSLENGDESGTKASETPAELDKPTEPLNLSHYQSHTSKTQKENDSNMVKLLDHCAAQVASLKISYDSENKHLGDKCIGNEVSNNTDTRNQLKNQLLLQNECICIPPIVDYSNQCNVKANVGSSAPYLMKNEEDLMNEEDFICVDDQKRSSILDYMGPITKNKLTFEYAQLNNQALSYIRDFRFELGTQNSTTMANICRPTFLPLFSSICSDTASDFPQSLCRKSSLLEKHSKDQEVPPRSTPLCAYSKFQCKLLPQVATLPLPEDATKEIAVMEKNHD
ncbi:APC membrane recruitment protein 3 [Sceloporus undulatus]|uniref:APC membrane recruitment protein 3 n=1 Tax=Sceloporus undulatus TaxID=8520 RepID=UPI001C4CAE15|nr:APC membrane recruitment protein 3 [Sceloporus undulatus]